jgi:hypothetical protein
MGGPNGLLGSEDEAWGAVLVGLALLAILAGCGSGESSDSTGSESSVALKLQLPNEPTKFGCPQFESTSRSPTESRFTRLFRRCRRRANGPAGTTTYAIKTIDLPGGTFYDIDAVVRACSESEGCGGGLSQIADCSAALDVDENEPMTFTIEMKSWDDPHCRFISS